MTQLPILALVGPEDRDVPISRPFIGSRELHRDLPKVLDSLEDPDVRYVLTIHSKPKAVLIGAEAFLELVRGLSKSDRLLALQLSALVQGLESTEPAPERVAELAGV